MSDLAGLRARIDELDRQLVRVVADRLAVCEEVARMKAGSDTPVIQPQRVRDVVTSRRQWAIDDGVDPDFVEQLVRVLLSETHRIEVAGARPDPAPEKLAASQKLSAVATVATRIDHVVVAVKDLDGVVDLFTRQLGFHREPLAGGEAPGLAAMTAGGVTIVFVSADASPAIADYLATNDSGVQHIAIEVLNARYARASLEANDAALLTDIVVDEHGHEQFFTVKDPMSGVQIGFISRVGHRVGVSAANVLALFDSL